MCVANRRDLLAAKMVKEQSDRQMMRRCRLVSELEAAVNDCGDVTRSLLESLRGDNIWSVSIAKF